MTSMMNLPVSFTVGICATGPSEVADLVKFVLRESESSGFNLDRVIVVASECPASVASDLRGVEAEDTRVHVLLEPVRHGKADAVNKILAGSRGDYVLMVNADAIPQPGSIRTLLSRISSDISIGAISAMAVVEHGKNLTTLLVEMMWSAHNESSRLLNHMNISNHASEELAAFRLSAIGMLPEGLVNDGAYLALTARRKGFSVKFSDSAKVLIETPSRISDLITQRRRILFGHTQAWRKSGTPPKTIESLLLLSPFIGLRLLIRILARRPRFMLVLPIAFVTELSAALLSIQDSMTSTKKHVIWRRNS